jgi:hypothetical protein
MDPQPASISPTINISIVFICPSLVDHGRIVCRPATKNACSAILKSGRAELYPLLSACTCGDPQKFIAPSHRAEAVCRTLALYTVLHTDGQNSALFGITLDKATFCLNLIFTCDCD